MIVAIIVIAAVLLFTLAMGFRHQCLLKERAKLMRDAIRHRDFSFRLPTKGLLFGERALQEALNDMGQEIRKLVAHNEVEAWQRLTRVLTHEIMNATTPIQSISQAYLSHSGIKGTPYEEGIQAIHDTSMGLATFVDSYRKMTQLQEPVLNDMNLCAFCNSISALYPNLKWNIEVPENIFVNADENLLRQVFINLVKNAIEADAKTIGVKHIVASTTFRHDANAFNKLQISNDGHIIPDEVAREIFIPFFTTKQLGSGIGLSLSRQILMMQQLTLSLRENPISGYNVTFEIESDR
ncbi:MAG: HAMP domain-containing histidine kinase [Bacteroidales bacterium]|nr:HAMP domain-containing histidine kinase [Bacteroidales bacterium]